jgi:hypothetical protein
LLYPTVLVGMPDGCKRLSLAVLASQINEEVCCARASGNDQRDVHFKP